MFQVSGGWTNALVNEYHTTLEWKNLHASIMEWSAASTTGCRYIAPILFNEQFHQLHMTTAIWEEDINNTPHHLISSSVTQLWAGMLCNTAVEIVATNSYCTHYATTPLLYLFFILMTVLNDWCLACEPPGQLFQIWYFHNIYIQGKANTATQAV